MGAGPAGLSAADELARNSVDCAMLEKDPATVKEPRSFEDWVSNQFGRRLFSIFFKTYTEKVWGIPTSELSADWAAQRIKGLNLFEAVRNALLPARGGQVIKTLIDRFHFP